MALEPEPNYNFIFGVLILAFCSYLAFVIGTYN